MQPSLFVLDIFLDDGSGNYNYEANLLVLPSITMSTTGECDKSIISISLFSLLESPSPFYQGINSKPIQHPTEVTISCIGLSRSLSYSYFCHPKGTYVTLPPFHSDNYFSKSYI